MRPTALVAAIALAVAASAHAKANLPAQAAFPSSNVKNTPAGREWRPVKKLLDGWVLTKNFAVVVGDSSGPLFEYLGGNFTLKTKVETASTSKWPVAMALAGLVNDGTIKSLDSYASDYISWWSTDRVHDPKANITLRHLLSFTSGFDDGETAGGGGNGASTCMDNITSPLGFLGCAEHIYRKTNMTGLPGETWTYNSVHLQLAGAVAVHASGLDIQAVIKKYLFDAYDMKDTTCFDGAPNPCLAVCLQTTGADYQNFLYKTLTASVLSQEIITASETDNTPFMKSYYQLYGLYGFGHFLECFDSINGFTAECEAAMIHCDPGAFGFYPLIDRANGYYMAVVAFETNEFYPRSGIPEYLRLAVKPFIDAVMSGDKNNGEEFGHHNPAYNSLSMADVNYIVGCYVHPETCA